MIKKVIPSAIGKNTHGCEEGSPFGCHDKIGVIDFRGGDGSDLEGHEIVNIGIDIGEVHEHTGMEESEETVEKVLGEFGFADVPDFLVLGFEVDLVEVFLLGEEIPPRSGCTFRY
jgi:hypothetical protein